MEKRAIEISINREEHNRKIISNSETIDRERLRERQREISIIIQQNIMSKLVITFCFTSLQKNKERERERNCNKLTIEYLIKKFLKIFFHEKIRSCSTKLRRIAIVDNV